MKNFNLTVARIAEIVAGQVVGDGDRVVSHVARIEDAGSGSITFLASKNFEKYFESTCASCVIIDERRDAPETEQRSYIRHAQPHRAFVLLLEHLLAGSEAHTGSIHPTALIASGAQVHSTAVIEAYVVVGEGSTVGANTIIKASSVLGDNVHIGSNCLLHPQVVVESECIIGNHCILHAHAVVGSDGFGYLENPDGSFHKIPQVGNVVVHDNVEIGAGTCIDRAALGSTVIEQGVKLDNHVHIAHNAVIKKDTAIAAQSGIAGGTIIGERNRIAGQVGVVGYVETASNVILGAQSGVSKSITQPGVYSGSPAMDLKQRLKQEAVIRRITKDA